MSTHDEGRPPGEPALNSTPIKSVPSLDPPADVPARDDTLTEEEAARLTTRIQLRLDMVADSIELVIPMIEAAKNGNAHQALGYQSWTAYVADKFGGTLARLGKSERLPFVELLAAQGMSTRAIASVVGTSHQTVANDMAGAPVKNLTPRLAGDAEELVDILAMAGVTEDEFAEIQVMADATKDEFEAALTEARSQDDLSRENVISIITKNTISKAATKNTITEVIPKKVTGIDGKSYTRPAPVETKMKNVTGIDGKPTRRSIIKIANLRTVVTRLSGHQDAYAGITAADPKLTSEEATRLSSDLSKSIAALQGLNRLIKEVATKPGDVR